MERDLEEMKRRLAASERTLASQQHQRTDETRDRLKLPAGARPNYRANLDALRLEQQALNGRLADFS
ncbi:MAG: hypothetical protein R2864_10860 [Syntrophotaleaceae bacterium]